MPELRTDGAIYQRIGEGSVDEPAGLEVTAMQKGAIPILIYEHQPG